MLVAVLVLCSLLSPRYSASAVEHNQAEQDQGQDRQQLPTCKPQVIPSRTHQTPQLKKAQHSKQDAQHYLTFSPKHTCTKTRACMHTRDVFTHARTHARARARTHTHTHTHTQTDARTHTYIHTHTYTHAHTRTHTYTHTRTHTHIHTHTFTHTHIHIYTHTNNHFY